ncbi:hypothetical protein KAU13_09180 [candidate division WOR-3 bacterium]|nr:hypothetical protein [candidate division WOR-3 bacterium]TET78435.1 MAG: hypothetical protein E3J41_04605 [Candidatus Cloacimonadota bacterium]
MKKGIALLTVLWILAILTVITGIIVFLTTSDIAYTFIFNKERIALATAEYGKNTVLSKIPQYELLSLMTENDSLFYDGSFKSAFRFQIRDNKYYLISPMPFPHGILQWGTGGKWYKIFNFNAGGRVFTARGDIERVVDVGAAYEHPLTGGGGPISGPGHTMY